MNRVVPAVVLSVAGFCGSAFADIAFTTNYTSQTNTYAPGLFTAGGPVSGNLAAPDGTTAGWLFFGAPSAWTGTMTMTFNASAEDTIAPSVLLYGILFQAGDTVSLTGVQWSNGTGSSVNYNPALALTNSVSPTDGVKIDGSLIGLGTLGSFSGINQLVLTFSGTTNGGTGFFLLDAVSNPEPGTFALFGLGAMGLGGFAWRRRKAKKAAAAQA